MGDKYSDPAAPVILVVATPDLRESLATELDRRYRRDDDLRAVGDGLFLLLGADPGCGWLPPEVARDEHGFA